MLNYCENSEEYKALQKKLIEMREQHLLIVHSSIKSAKLALIETVHLGGFFIPDFF